MTSATVTLPRAATADGAAPKRPFRWGNVGTVAILALVVVWCFLPFYWMVVLAFRNNANTYDTTPFFSHVTFGNFRYAFNTSINKFGQSLINSLLIGAVVTVVASFCNSVVAQAACGATCPAGTCCPSGGACQNCNAGEHASNPGTPCPCPQVSYLLLVSPFTFG